VIERLNAISKVAPLSEVDLQAWNTTLNNARMARDEATKQYAEFPEDRLTHYEEEKKKVNRDVATLILSKGGSITIVTPEKTWLQQHITRAKELPSDGFQITAVSLKDGKVDDQLLAVLERLTTLQYLFLDNTNVTDESVRMIVNRATIRSLNLNGTPVTKDVLEALTGVKTLSLRGTRISPEDLASFAALNPSIDVLPRIESTSTRPLESLSSLPKSFAMRFDGVSRVELPVKCTQGPAISIEAWVWRPLAIFTTLATPLTGINMSTDGKPRGLMLHIKGRNFFIGESRNANGDFIVTQRVGHFPDEKWTHLAVTLDGGELRVHQDGKRLASTAIALPTDGTQLNFAIGAGPGGGWPFVGIVDEVRISDTARYLDDFDPPRRFEPDKNTLALYHFDEGSGETVHDASGNGHDGKVVGTPEWVPEAEVDK